MSRKLRIVPIDPPDESLSELALVHVSPPGYAFQVPWDDVDTHKSTKSSSSVRFKSGIFVFAMAPTSDLGFASGSRKLPDDKMRVLLRVFGEGAMRSDYQFLTDELQETPDQIRWWARSRNVKASILLGLKWTEVSSSEAVFRIDGGDLKGFEFIDSESTPRMVKLKLFDRAEQLYEVLIASPATAPPITQPDINAIVASMRPIPHS
jgi:hypothetical protein